jgi:hypothetical protein
MDEQSRLSHRSKIYTRLMRLSTSLKCIERVTIVKVL